MDEQPQMPRTEENKFDKQRMDQFSRFLHTTTIKGEEDRFKLLGLLLGKEVSTGNIVREDMGCNEYETFIIQNLFLLGQEDLGFTFLISFISVYKQTMSVDHIMIDGLTKSKMEYAQTYTVHEHQHQEPGQRRGFLGAKGPQQ